MFNINYTLQFFNLKLKLACAECTFFSNISNFFQLFLYMQILNNVKKYKYFLIKIFEKILIFLFNIDIKFKEKFILIINCFQ